MKIRLMILITFLMILTLSCNAIQNLGQPTSAPEKTAQVDASSQATLPSPTVEPTSQASDQGGSESILGGGQAGPQTLDLADPALYAIPSTSYMITAKITYAGADTAGQAQTAELNLEVQVQTEPEQAKRMHMETTEPGGGQILTITTIGGQDYMDSGGGECVIYPTSELSDSDLSSEEIAKELVGQAEQAEKGVKIGEVQTDRYTLTQANFTTDSFDLAEGQEVQSASLYRARDGGALVRLEMTVVGKVSEYGFDPEKPVTIQMAYDQIFLKPGSLNIQAPEDCAGLPTGGEAGESSGGSQAEGDIPMPPEEQISNLFSMSGVLTFNTTMDFQAAISFYKTEMLAKGWALDQEYVSEYSAFLSYKQGERTAEVTITPPSDSNPVLVVIITGP